MTQNADLRPGFAHHAFDAQATFRAAMMALARPGKIHAVDVPLDPPPPLSHGAGALALTLCDTDTPIWVDERLSGNAAVKQFLRFHTGARFVTQPSEAAFAIATDPRQMPALEELALGTLEYPDRSTTLLVQLETLDSTRGWRLSGPGVTGEARLMAEPIGTDFLTRLAENRRLFPRGIDLFLVAGNRIVALPRTTRVES